MSAGFWALALLWLPIVERADFLISFVPWMDRVNQPDTYLHLLVNSAVALVILAPMGLPSALLCRELWRSGYRRMAWSVGVVVFVAAVVIISSDKDLIYTLPGDHRQVRACAKPPYAGPAGVDCRLPGNHQHAGLDRGRDAPTSPERIRDDASSGCHSGCGFLAAFAAVAAGTGNRSSLD